MRNLKFWSFLLMFIVLFLPIVFGAKGDITLLTVGETTTGERVGDTAKLHLNVESGSGRVFINSFPFTREDTQVSVRFAKNVACNFLEIDCELLDFFYTIDISSSSVGGPSAGAAITALTISVLSNNDLDDDVVVTGTINSGGIIGPVSGLREKAIAAKDAGFDKILVPKNAILINETLEGINQSEIDSDDFNASNATIVFADSLNITGIEVVPVSTLEEVIFEFMNMEYPDYSHNISVPVEYQNIMSHISESLCNRSYEILDLVPESVKSNNSDVLSNINESLELSVNATASSDFYSAASFCFTANTALRALEFEDYSDERLENISLQIDASVDVLLDDLNSRKLDTMSDLETYIIVKERLLESKSLLEENDSLDNLGYIMERRYSAIAWSEFFKFEKGKRVVLDDVFLEQACISKIAEGEERLSYIDFITGNTFNRSELVNAKKFYEEGDFAYCIFKAAKVKADANAIILSMSLTRDRVTEMISDQLRFARMQINKQGDNFPILGYSYYDYASNLIDSRPQLSMIFAEYASEFSNLDMYFPSDKKVPWRIMIGSFNGFISGFFIGLIFCMGAWSLSVIIYRAVTKKKSSKNTNTKDNTHKRTKRSKKN